MIIINVTAWKANQRKLDSKAWGKMNHNNIQEAFRDNLKWEEMTKEIEKNDKHKNAIRENGWKYAWLTSEWKNAHYLGKIQFWINFRRTIVTGSDRLFFLPNDLKESIVIDQYLNSN